jgi:hypothetical protein
MLIVETVVRIRREHAAGKAIKAIARDLRLSRKVVRKAIRSPEAAFNYQRKVQPLPRIGPYQDRLDALLEENEGSGRRDRLRMTRIHAGPFGPLTIDDLPSSGTTYWVSRRKAEVLAAIDGGMLALEDACEKYRISPEELAAWRRSVDRAGIPGLRVTKTREYRGRYIE